MTLKEGKFQPPPKNTRIPLMSAYYAIFATIPYISGTLLVIAAFSLVFERNALLLRSIAFSLQFWVAPLFFFYYLATVQRISSVVVIAGCLELLFLVVYQFLFRKLFTFVSNVNGEQYARMRHYLKKGTWILIALSIPLYVQGGMGIFSGGSRIEALSESRLDLYLVYASSLVQVAMVPIVAAVINSEKRWSQSVVAYIFLISILSILSASKGAVILTLLAITSLLRFDRAREYVRVLWGPVCGGLAIVAATVYFVGKFASLDPKEMISLMFSRLFLTNDGRALAIDWSAYFSTSNSSLFRESFRLYANLLGNSPKYPPLGQYLYSLAFGTDGLAGANTSATALLIAYGSEAEKLVFAMLLGMISITIAAIGELSTRNNLAKLAVAISLLSLLSQDFLAFQLTANILVLMLVAFLLLGFLANTTKLACESSRAYGGTHNSPLQR